MGAQYYIQHGYPDVAKEFVQACTGKQIVSEAQTESYAELLGVDQYSVNVVAIIKNKADTVDPFSIYKIIDRKWNNCGTYVFKSSQTAAEIGLVMDRTARKTPLKELVVYMDGLHSCVKGFVTLTLWVKNPTSLITHCLACMECESEDTQNVTLSFACTTKSCTRSKVILPMSGLQGYYDRQGANKNAVRAVLGEVMSRRTWSCTWHYL